MPNSTSEGPLICVNCSRCPNVESSIPEVALLERIWLHANVPLRLKENADGLLNNRYQRGT